MFSVLFEVNPRLGQMDNYLGNAKLLKPELEKIEGFVDNVRYRSLTRDGWLLSLSNWRDEKSVVRWRTHMRHHEIQEKGRNEIFADYHLRVGQLFHDTQLPQGCELHEQRLDETEVGEGTTVTLVTAKRPGDWKETSNPTECAQYLGLDIYAGDDLASWDVYDSVLTPGDLILFLTWRNRSAIDDFENGEGLDLPDTHRIRHVRIVRDYGMYDRREAPQYYPAAKK